ncbi:hypothetical protein B0H10DRAFT_2242914 [Mycena sp. CBHHK59/15]|nr:hypothetical protein B0H10DRAFT_2242914 [Mycena sp. CBHHK59/15]
MTRLSTKPTNPYHYLQLRQHVISAVVPVHTHQEYITLKANIDRHDFRKSERQYSPHERWKNVDFDKFTRWWNAQVNFQPCTITESNLRLYYKIPQQLEAHHKKTILWSSERSTLAAGANFAARQEFVDILNAESNSANVLPAIQLTAVPDSELDLSSAALDEPTSFDSMSGHPVEGDQLDSVDELIEWETTLDNAAPEIPVIPPPLLPSIPPLWRYFEREKELGQATAASSAHVADEDPGIQHHPVSLAQCATLCIRRGCSEHALALARRNARTRIWRRASCAGEDTMRRTGTGSATQCRHTEYPAPASIHLHRERRAMCAQTRDLSLCGCSEFALTRTMHRKQRGADTPPVVRAANRACTRAGRRSECALCTCTHAAHEACAAIALRVPRPVRLACALDVVQQRHGFAAMQGA